MASDARFGIELYEQAHERQTVEGSAATIVGHVWSPDAERIIAAENGEVRVIDPSGANPTFLNTTLDDTEAFLEAFRVFYLGERPGIPLRMTADEARSRLAALQRGETLVDPVAPASAPRGDRAVRLRETLEAQDPRALSSGTWWSRILQRAEFGRE